MRVSLFSGSVLVENSMPMYGPSAVGAAVGTGSPGTLGIGVIVVRLIEFFISDDMKPRQQQNIRLIQVQD
jgi:hypothetical protein